MGIVERRRLSVRVSVVSSASGLDTIQDEWIRLYEQDPRATPWSDPRLLVPFHRMFVRTLRPCVLIARSDDGAVRGVLPLAIERRRIGPVVTRRLISLISWHACFPDVVLDPQLAQAVLPAIARSVMTLRWEDFLLRRMRNDGWIADPAFGFLEVLRAHADGLTHRSRRAGSVQISIDDTAMSVRLDRTEPFQRGRDRSDAKKIMRLLESEGALVIGWEGSSTALKAAREFVELHRRLKLHQGQTTTFLFGSARQDFPMWLCQSIHAGRAGLFTVRLDGQMLAGVVILRAMGRAHAYRAARDPAANVSGIGILQVTQAIEACRQLGDNIFDLGAGNDPYKRTWAPDVQPLTSISADRPTWRGRTANAWLRVRGKR